MTRGRKPTAHNLKVLAGTARPDRERNDSVPFDMVTNFPLAPQHLNPDGAAMWNELGPQLLAAGTLKIVDLYQLQQLCYCWQRHVKKQKADMDITAAEDNALKGLFSEFGMSWNARQKLSSATKKENSFSGNGRKPAQNER